MMEKTIKEMVKELPVIGKVGMRANQWLYIDRPWTKERSEILASARLLFSDAYASTLDVTKRYGIYLFHNKNNLLIKHGKTFEPEVQQALKVLVNLDKLRNGKGGFADVGANIGLHTFFIHTEFPELDIVAFDPSPFAYTFLELSLAFNSMRNIELMKIALTDQDGELEFYNWGAESCFDSLRDTRRVPGIEPRVIRVPAKRLDDLSGLPPLTVIKMDCEGAELTIIRGAIETIRDHRPYILLEFQVMNRRAFGVTTDKIFALLKEIDYSLFSLDFKLLDQAEFDHCQESNVENFIIMPNGFARSMR